MGILDTFYILFKSDASDVEKGAKKAKDAVDDLEQGISGADKTTVNLGKKFNSLATQALAAFGLVFSVTSLTSGARAIGATSTDLLLLGETIDENVVGLTNWARAVEANKGSADAFKGSVRGMNMALEAALASTGPNALTIALSKLKTTGFDAEKNIRPILDLLPDMAKGAEDLERAFARGVLADAGLDPGLINFLLKGEKFVRAQVAVQAKLNLLTKEDLQTANEANLALKRRWNWIKDIGTLGLVEIIEDVKDPARLPELARAQDAASRTLLNSVLELFPLIFSRMGDIFESPKIRRKFSPPDPVSIPELLKDKISSVDIHKLRNEMIAMASTPLSAIGAQSSAGSVSNRSSSISVTVEDVNIKTQATDPNAIAASISRELEIQLSNAIEQTDDGIVA